MNNLRFRAKIAGYSKWVNEVLKGRYAGGCGDERWEHTEGIWWTGEKGECLERCRG